MTLTKMLATLGLWAALFGIAVGIVHETNTLLKRFSDLDTRMAKLESAIKALDSAQPDERYRTLIKELIAKQNQSSAPKEDGARSMHTFGGPYPADAGASASSPAMVKPQ